MPKKKSDPKTAPGLVTVRLQVAPADHDRLRVVAAKAGKSMAIFAREAVLKAVAAGEK